MDCIESSRRIEVMTGTEVSAVHGASTVESVSLRDRDRHTEEVESSAVYVMIGADPCAEASAGILAVDETGCLLCGDGALTVRFAYGVLADETERPVSQG